jgi:hypothetical protein
LFRFYSDCCKTPLGNTVSPSIPFVGVVAKAFETDTRTATDLFGEPMGAIWGQHAVGTPPKGSTSVNVPLLVRSVGIVLGWKLSGKSWPHPYFDPETRAPRYPLAVLGREEREALREKCGPRPA